MKFGVVGSRNFSNFRLLTEVLDRYNIGLIISGAADGADTLAVDYAKAKGIPYIEHPAAWDDLSAEPCVVKTNKAGKKYNALAGYNRNQDIVNDSDIIIAFTNGSSGTADTIKRAKEKGIPIQIIPF